MNYYFCPPPLYTYIYVIYMAVGMPTSRGCGGEDGGLRARGHSRSASHGAVGATLSPATSLGAVGRPSALKNRGHQRAFSQGTIETESTYTKSHNRVGSKTDFILPPGHRENDSFTALTQRKSGHSRQASRSESVYTLRNNPPPPKWRQYLCSWFQISPEDEEPRCRTVVPNHLVPPQMPEKLHPNGNRCDNRIRTTKYTLLSFLPKNLLEQFHRVANLYFIFIVLLNWVPSINAFGKEVAMIPVMFVLGVTGIKDLFEDRRRHASDKRINNSFCRVYAREEERYLKRLWKEIRVGDIVHLSNNEFIPADILLLKSSDPQGLCYIDSCNLDGETNLKLRQVARGFIERQSEFSPSQFRSVIEVDAPTTKIYRFHGAIVHPSGERVPVGTENLLLRDCVLKNTDYIEGIVVYAGHETKAMLNNNGPRYKRSTLEKKMNEDIMWCVVILLVFCSLGATGSWLHLSSYPEEGVLFLPFNGFSTGFEGFITFWTFIIILQVMIPLSLYVTVEMAKLLQVYHINNNIELYDVETDKKVECRALNITEELGQIQYIFSDKTGTLTENKMLFRRCTIDGHDYNHAASENLTKSNSDTTSKNVNPSNSLSLNGRLQSELNSTGSHKVREFLIVLALCNTVIVAKHPHHDIMDASGILERDMLSSTIASQPSTDDGPILEEPTPEESSVHVEFVTKTTATSNTNSRYKRLAESRSITPSPTPLMKDILDNDPLTAPTNVSSLINSMGPITPIKETPNRPKLLNVSMPQILSNVVNRKTKNGVSKVTAKAKSLPTPTESKPIFEAESPDELALVQTAHAYDVKLLARTPNSATISILGETFLDYDVLHILPFDSSRKCMSIIVRDPSNDDVVIMYTKGADSTILAKLAPVDDLQSQQLLFKTQQHLNTYARLGLRVLVMASRRLTMEDYTEWEKKVISANMANDMRERKLKEAYIDIEKDLTLIGATGIEDRLQDGVPETISSLRAAGIVVWVLTGDKPETAINVAYSARLFLPNMEILKLFARSKEAAESTINFYLNNITRTNSNYTNRSYSNTLAVPHSPPPSSSSISDADRVPKKKALVIDGKTLTYILDRRSNLQEPFLELTKHCTAVLGCRATPLQKAYIVRIVKERLNMRTLAIGDGANDVSMIQTADVGIGISGQEGMQACMASDFTMPRFKYLERLLLVHGHWAYDRLAHMVLYFFYKNATFVFLIFLYQFYCGFSGTVMIDQMYHMLYNLVFTSLPPLTIGVYDQDVHEQLLLTRPGLYRKGRLGHSYQSHSFWVSTADAFYQSCVILFVAAKVYTGTDAGIWEFGTTIVTSCMFAMLVQAALETRSWTILQVGSIILSIGGYFLFCLIYNSICMQCLDLPSNVWVLRTTLASPIFWAVVLLSTVAALLPRVTIKVLCNVYCPGDTTRAVIEEQQVTAHNVDNFLVSWSRSTSTSSIYRTNETAAPRESCTSAAPTMTAVG